MLQSGCMWRRHTGSTVAAWRQRGVSAGHQQLCASNAGVTLQQLPCKNILLGGQTLGSDDGASGVAAQQAVKQGCTRPPLLLSSLRSMRWSLQRLAAAAHGTMALREVSSPRMACRIHLQVGGWRSGVHWALQQARRDAQLRGWAGGGSAWRRRRGAGAWRVCLHTMLPALPLTSMHPGCNPLWKGPS